MTQQSKTCDICDCLHPDAPRCSRRTSIEFDHRLNGQLHQLVACGPVLRGGRDDAGAKGFGEYEGLTRLGSVVGGDVLGRGSSGYGESVLRLRIVDRVSAEHGTTGLGHYIETAFDHLCENIERNLVTRPPDELQRGERVCSHGVDVTQRVRCRDPAPVVGIVDYGREEVDCLDDRPILSDLKNPGVIRTRDPYEEIRVGRGWVIVRGTQNLRQLVRTELARSTGAVGKGSEPDLFHTGTIYDTRLTTHDPWLLLCAHPRITGDGMRVAVIGGGTMGIGIAHRFAANGAVVWVVDVDLDIAQSAVDRVVETLANAAERGKLDPNDLDRVAGNLQAVGAVGDLEHGLDLIVEAVIEDVGLKALILAAAEAKAPTVLASNTSSISIDELAEGLAYPDRFAGMHFFNPVWAMHLVEVIRGADTSTSTLEKISAMVAFLGMEQALINDAPGFATSRLGVLVGIEAIRMVQEGVAEPADIDRAMSLGYRHPMGPLMLGDLVGLDVRLKIASHLASVYGDRFEPPELLTRMVAEGRLGKKSGVGFYDWTSGSAVPIQES